MKNDNSNNLPMTPLLLPAARVKVAFTRSQLLSQLRAFELTLTATVISESLACVG